MEPDGVVRVPLWARSGEVRAYALVDADRAAEVLAYRWYLGSHGYAVRNAPRSEGKRTIRLHRFLLDLVPGDGIEADHINGNTLDNRLMNLRIVPIGTNAQNKNFCTTGSSRFRGVTWDRSRGAWKAQAGLARGKRNLGRFDSEIAAAQVVEAWRLEHMPFAQPDPELLRYHEEQNAH